MDDSSSTCSTDSLPSLVVIGSCKGNSIPNKNTKLGSTSWGKSHKCKAEWANQKECPPPSASAMDLTESSDDPGISSRAIDNESEADATSVPSLVRRVENAQVRRVHVKFIYYVVHPYSSTTFSTTLHFVW